MTVKQLIPYVSFNVIFRFYPHYTNPLVIRILKNGEWQQLATLTPLTKESLARYIVDGVDAYDITLVSGRGTHLCCWNCTQSFWR
jgi:hypothetical protein